MEKVLLDGFDSMKIVIDEPLKRLHFSNINLDATIKVSIEREGNREYRSIPTMKLIDLLEIQNKAKMYTDSLSKAIIILKHYDKDDDDTDAVRLLHDFFIDLTKGGELNVLESDKITVELGVLGSLNHNSTVEPVNSLFKGGVPYEISDLFYPAIKKEKEYNLSGVDYLAFNTDEMPSELLLYYNNDYRKITSDYLKSLNLDVHGQVLFGGSINYDDDDNSSDRDGGLLNSSPDAIYHGYNNILLLPVGSATRVICRDEENSEDYSFYSIKK